LDEGWVPQIGQALAQAVVGCGIFGFRCLGFGLLQSFWGFGVLDCGVGEVRCGVWVGG